MPPFNPYRTWLNAEYEDSPPDKYALLGLQRLESDPQVIKAAADEKIALIRNIRPGEQIEQWGRLLDELQEAKLLLLDLRAKKKYDAQLLLPLVAKSSAAPFKQGQESITDSPPAVAPPLVSPSVTPPPVQTVPPFLSGRKNAEEISGRSDPWPEPPPRNAPPQTAPYSSTWEDKKEGNSTSANDPTLREWNSLPFISTQSHFRDDASAASRETEETKSRGFLQENRRVVLVCFLLLSAVLSALLLILPGEREQQVVSTDQTSLKPDSGAENSSSPMVEVKPPASGEVGSETPQVPRPAGEDAAAGNGTTGASAVPSADGVKEDTNLSSNTEDTSSASNDPPSPSSEQPPQTEDNSQKPPSSENSEPKEDPAIRAQFEKGLKEWASQLAYRNSPAAAKALETIKKLSQNEKDQELVERLVLIQDYHQQFWKGIAQSISKLEVGGELELDGLPVNIVEAERDRLTIHMQGRNITYRIQDLPGKILQSLLAREFNLKSRDTKIIVAAFMAYDRQGDRKTAIRLWREADQKENPTQPFIDDLSRLQLYSPGEGSKGKSNGEEENALKLLAEDLKTVKGTAAAELSEKALATVEVFLQQKQFQQAEEAADLALQAARKTQNLELMRRAAMIKRQVSLLKKN